MPKGQKHDGSKPRYSLIPRSVLGGLVRVLEFGAQKYAVDNWKHVEDPLRRYRDAMDRHWDAATGTGLCHKIEHYDAESGLEHAYHFLCCAVFLAWFLVNKQPLVNQYRDRENG